MVNSAFANQTDVPGQHYPGASVSTVAFPVSVATALDDATACLDRHAPSAFPTGYQGRTFVEGWLTAGVEPVFVTIETSAGPVLLPLQRMPGDIAVFIGDRHANGNFPIGTREAITALADQGVSALQSAPALKASGLHVLALERQYAHWNGMKNPFVTDHSIDSALSLSLRVDCGMDAVLERTHSAKRLKKFRQQTRRMGELGPVAVEIPTEQKRASDLLDKLLDWKSRRLIEMGIPDIFADQTTCDALRAMFAGPDAGHNGDGQRLVALNAGEQTMAILGLTLHGDRCTVEFSTFNPDHGKMAPGEALFHRAIEWAADNGLTWFDFGVGDEHFKRSWCDVETRHQDSFVPLSLRGRVMVARRRAQRSVIQKIKDNQKLFRTLKSVRKSLVGARTRA